jgi:hypothetical protein
MAILLAKPGQNVPGRYGVKSDWIRAESDDAVAHMEKSGAGEGIRTLDPNLGKVVLYP